MKLLSINIKNRKDSIIWLSASGPFGIEIIRAQLTPDSIYFVNRINKTYLIKPASHVKGFIKSELSFYDLQNGCFSSKVFAHTHFISGEDLQNFKALLFKEKKKISQENRKKILLILLDYYKLHHHELKNLKSHSVIEQLRQ